MFFGKNKTSLKLAKQHSELLQGCEYHIVEYLTNPKVIRVGSGLTQLYLRNSDGEEFLIEGNASKIKDLFIPIQTFEGLQGTSFKVKRPIGSLLQNQVLKEISSCPYDEKMQLGHGISEHYFIQQNTNKVIKFYGNSHQIKNLFEEIIVPVKSPEVKPVAPKTKIEIIERTIVKETTPVMGVQGFKGDEGIQGKQGIQGLRGDRGIQGEVGPQGEIGPQGEVGPQGPKGDNGDIGARGAQGLQGNQGIQGDKGDKGDQGIQGLVGKQGIQGTQGEQGGVGPEGPIGPQGPVGLQGIRGEKGEKGDRGPVGIQGSNGAKGERGKDGLVGPQGPAGESPVIEAEFPLVLEDGVLSFHSEHVTNVLNTFKNDDIQKAIDRIGLLATPGGGGGVDVSLNSTKIIRNPNTINFIGDNVTITRRRKNIDISISGSSGGGSGGVASVNGMTGAINFKAGPGITYSVSGNTYSFQSNYITTGVTGVTSAFDDDVILLERVKGISQPLSGMRRIPFKYFVESMYQQVPPTNTPTLIGQTMLLGSNLQINSNTAIAEILSGAVTSVNGLTGAVFVNKFTYGLTASAGSTQGDRWMASDTGIEYVYINDGNSQQWIQPTSNGSQGPQGNTGNTGATGATGSQGNTGATGSQGNTGNNGNTGATGADGQPGQSSNYYSYKVHTTTQTPPTGNGEIRYNNATQTSSTTLYVDHLNSNGDDIDIFLSLLKQNDTLIIQDANDSNNYQTWRINSVPTVILNDYTTIPVTKITSAGTGTSGFSNNHSVLFIVFSSPIATAYVESFNGLTGAVTGVSTLNGLTGAVQYIVDFKRGWFLS